MCALSRMTVLTGPTKQSHDGVREFILEPEIASNSFPAMLRKPESDWIRRRGAFKMEGNLVPELFDVYQIRHRTVWTAIAFSGL